MGALLGNVLGADPLSLGPGDSAWHPMAQGGLLHRQDREGGRGLRPLHALTLESMQPLTSFQASWLHFGAAVFTRSVQDWHYFIALFPDTLCPQLQKSVVAPCCIFHFSVMLLFSTPASFLRIDRR